MDISIVDGDLLTQSTESIVNPWNRNVIPWWLLLPHGVSGAIKERAGLDPFREVGRMGPIPLGGAVRTSAGKLPFKCIIHVASIDLFWRATDASIYHSVVNAVELADKEQLKSLAFPILGTGSGGFDQEKAESIMIWAFEKIESDLAVTVVRYRAEQAL